MEVLQSQPTQAYANSLMGQIKLAQHGASASLIFFNAALESDPHQETHWLNFIGALIQVGNFDDAKVVLGYGLEAGLSDASVEILQRAISSNNELQSLHTDISVPSKALENELIAVFSKKNYLEVEAKTQFLLDQYPHWLVGWKILSDTLIIQGKDARFSALKALELNPEDAKEYCYYGLILKEQGDLKGSALAFERAVQLNPDYAAAYNNLGILYKDLGDVERGIHHYKKALALNPSYASCFSNLLFCLSHYEKISQFQTFTEHLKFAKFYEEPLKASWPFHKNDRDPQRQLRIGFVSSGLRDHSLSYFIEPVIQILFKDKQFVLHAYATNHAEDDVTLRLKQNFHAWYPISHLKEIELATKIQDDQIDILIDLDGHTAGNRLLVFARKVAPIQMSWLGYLATTGLSAIDYYLADAYLLPHNKFDDQFSEKIIRLPVNAPFTPSMNAPKVNALPALKNGYLTYGCFNRVNKINQQVVSLWAKLLKQQPQSRLLMAGMPKVGSYDQLIEWFEAANVSESRIDFHAQTSTESYLKLYQDVDLCLDTFPSSGVTTTCHAAWMGVPTLCLEGSRLSSRGASAIMMHLGLDAFVPADEIDFLQKGIEWTKNIEKLACERQKMRTYFKHSNLAKPETVSKGLAIAMRKAWHKWCLNIPIESMEINSNDSY